MVTHLTTNQPVTSLNRAERTGHLDFWYLWSYVLAYSKVAYYILILAWCQRGRGFIG